MWSIQEKSAKEANQLVEYLAKSNYRALTKTSGSISKVKGGGMLKLNKMTTIEAKMDILMSKVNTRERRSHSKNTVGIEEGGEQKC